MEFTDVRSPVAEANIEHQARDSVSEGHSFDAMTMQTGQNWPLDSTEMELQTQDPHDHTDVYQSIEEPDFWGGFSPACGAASGHVEHSPEQSLYTNTHLDNRQSERMNYNMPEPIRGPRNSAYTDQSTHPDFRAASAPSESNTRFQDGATTHNQAYSTSTKRTGSRRSELRLEAPLSVLVNRYDITIQNASDWVNRPQEKRHSEANKIRGKAPQPPNALQIYQMIYEGPLRELWGANVSIDTFKTLTTQSWNSEHIDVISYYEYIEDEELKAHCRAFPDYRGTSANVGRKRKHATEEYRNVDTIGSSYDKPATKRARH